ncbi:MAG TPA: hypothetical protein VIN08_19815 [Ohtaekwangia sp.]|uniref:CHASE3 domain-containing protein n=1 Tax=Ohtaekwangia sp. TaxID=2066019 RepID=UPI002F925A26
MQENITGKKKVRENLVQYSIYLTTGFILLSVVLSFWNRHVTYDTRAIIESCDRIRDISGVIQKNLVEDVNFGVRAFITSNDDKFLKPYHQGLSAQDSLFEKLEEQLVSQGITSNYLPAWRTSVADFLRKEQSMIASIRRVTLYTTWPRTNYNEPPWQELNT